MLNNSEKKQIKEVYDPIIKLGDKLVKNKYTWYVIGSIFGIFTLMMIYRYMAVHYPNTTFFIFMGIFAVLVYLNWHKKKSRDNK